MKKAILFILLTSSAICAAKSVMSEEHGNGGHSQETISETGA